MKSDESSDFSWSGGTLRKAIRESVESACKTLGLENESCCESPERIGKFDYEKIAGQFMLKWNFRGSAKKASFIEIAFATKGKDDWLITVTTSDGFCEAYTLPGDDETAFDPVRSCVFDRLKEF